MSFFLLHLENMPIFKQLQLEEALLRVDHRNFCLINSGAPLAIVMGLSAKPQELLNLPLVQKERVPVIKRFSGGGTVCIDEETLFVTFISNVENTSIDPYPHTIMQWTEKVYAPFFRHSDFKLQENDYVLKDRKCGGNAQYIQKGRWLHHTSFLWDFDPKKMQYLSMPERRPVYRQDRSHSDFLVPLKNYFPDKKKWIEDFKEHLKSHFLIEEIALADVQPLIDVPHRKSTHYTALH